MGLSGLRRSSKSLWIKILLGAVALSFVIGFGAMSYVGRVSKKGGGNAAETWVAKVDGVPIDIDLVLRAEKFYEEKYREQFGDLADVYLAQMDLVGYALSGVINERVIEALAAHLGLTVADREVAEMIYRNPAFQADGQFSQERYIQILRRQKIPPQEFEIDLKRQLLAQKLRNLVFSSVRVADSDVREEFDARETKVNLRFLKILPKVVENDINVTERDVRAFFDKDPEQFKSEEKRKVNYVVFNAEDYTDEITVTDEQVDRYYEANREKEFKQPEQVHARHILIKAEAGADAALKEAARLKAEGLREQLVAGADFAKLAEENSEDPGSKVRGGDLGTFPRGRMVEAFEETAFSLKPGEISELVETQFGFHIIETLEKQEESVMEKDAVADRIKRKLVAELGNERAMADAKAAKAQLPAGTDLLTYGNDNDKKVGSSSTFTKAGGVPGVPYGNRASRPIFEMEVDQISEPFAGGAAVYLFELTNIIEPTVPEFDEIKDQVEAKLREDLQKTGMETKANELLAALRAGRALDALGAEYGIEPEETGLFSRQNASIPKIGMSAELMAEAFTLGAANAIASQPYKSGPGVVVCVLKEYVAPDAAKFAADKDGIHDEMLQQKAQLTLQAWVEQAENLITVERNEPLLAELQARSKAKSAAKKG